MLIHGRVGKWSWYFRKGKPCAPWGRYEFEACTDWYIPVGVGWLLIKRWR